MKVNFRKTNFILWVKIANYLSFSDSWFHISDNSDYFYRWKKQIFEMANQGYLIKKKTAWNKNSYKFQPTNKFKKEFIENYKKISKQIRPDFSDQLIEEMFKAFKISSIYK